METNKIYQGDCLEELDKLKEKSVNLVIIDPPFFMKLDHFKTRTFFKRNFADLGIIESFFKQVFEKIMRVLKDDGRLYCFCDGQSYPLFWFYLFPYTKSVRPLVWDKKTSINGYSWRHQHELIIFAEMPKTKPIPSGDGDILRFNAVKVDVRTHPAEKPLELIKSLILKSSKEGDLVLDCFAGTGVVGMACKETKREYILIEKEPTYFNVALSKLNSEGKGILPTII
jgi:site-specific DNA-methyltransferase (adenine-specific)